MALSRGSPCQLQCPCHWGCCWFSFSSDCFCCFRLLLSSLLRGHNLWSWVVFTTTLSYCNISSVSACFSHCVSPFPPACVKPFPPLSPSHISPRLPSHHPQSHSPVRLLQRHFSVFCLCKLTSLLQEASSRPSVVCPGLSSCSLCPP